MSNNLADRLSERIKETRAPIVVGLDPRLNQIPLVYREGCDQSFAGAAEAIVRFNRAVIDAACELVPAVKPQIAFYEQFGHEGIRVFEETVAYAKEKGLIVIADAKRNDIGSTARAYATAYLSDIDVFGKKLPSPYAADFLTVSPYEGAEGIEPFFGTARDTNKGVFVLVKTSNPGSLMLQTARCDNSKTVAVTLAELIDKQADDTVGECGYSAIGAVVGATYPQEALTLRAAMPRSWLLVPGYGAQGANGADIVASFGADGLGAVVNSSRGIIFAYEKETDATIDDAAYKTSVRKAIEAMREDIYEALKQNLPGLAY